MSNEKTAEVKLQKAKESLKESEKKLSSSVANLCQYNGLETFFEKLNNLKKKGLLEREDENLSFDSDSNPPSP